MKDFCTTILFIMQGDYLFVISILKIEVDSSRIFFDAGVIQLYQDAGHVISSYSLISIWSQNLLEQLFNTYG